MHCLRRSWRAPAAAAPRLRARAPPPARFRSARRLRLHAHEHAFLRVGIRTGGGLDTSVAGEFPDEHVPAGPFGPDLHGVAVRVGRPSPDMDLTVDGLVFPCADEYVVIVFLRFLRVGGLVCAVDLPVSAAGPPHAHLRVGHVASMPCSPPPAQSPCSSGNPSTQITSVICAPGRTTDSTTRDSTVRGARTACVSLGSMNAVITSSTSSSRTSPACRSRSTAQTHVPNPPCSARYGSSDPGSRTPCTCTVCPLAPNVASANAHGSYPARASCSRNSGAVACAFGTYRSPQRAYGQAAEVPAARVDLCAARPCAAAGQCADLHVVGHRRAGVD